MSAAHTTGPWCVDLAVECPNVRIVGPNGRGLAVSLQRDTHPREGQGITDEEALANAVLIAAAPELLDALLAVVYLNDSGRWAIGIHGDSDVTDLVGAAIAKATGEAA